MTNADLFFEAWTNLPHVVLGKRLRPLSLFHLVWLHQLRSPLVLTSQPATLEDLEIAVMVCASSSSEGVLRRLDARGDIFKETANYLWRRANRRKRNFQEELTKFLSYNDDHIALPAFMPGEGEQNESLPWLLLHAASLIKATGWSEDSVFAMPVGKVLWLNLAFGYLKTGETRVMSDKEVQAAKAIAELYGPALTPGGK